jgi:hypothetical protein
VSEHEDPNRDVDWEAFEHQIADAEEGKPRVSVHTVTPEMLAKRLVWGVAPCTHAAEVAQFLGLHPASEEVEDMEHQEAHQRLLEVEPMLPILQQLAYHASRAVVGSMIVSGGDQENVSEVDRDEAATRLMPVVYQTCWAILGEMMDIGMLHTPHILLGDLGDLPNGGEWPE